MASNLFKNYNFRTGKLTVSKRERLHVLLPVCARKTEIVLLIKQCSVNGANGSRSVIVPHNNEIQLTAGKRKAFKFELVNCKTKFHSQILKLEVNPSQKTLEVNSSENGLQ